MGLGTGGGEWGGVGGTGKKAEFVLLAGPGAPEESPRRALVASVAGSGGQWWSHLAISSAVWARPGKPVVRGGGGGLPTNPDQSLPPVAMAAAAVPLCQTERGGKERERKKKKTHTNSLGSTFENNISSNKECMEGTGGGRRAGGRPHF